MRTTVRMQPELLREARLRAAGSGTTLTALMEEGLRLVLSGKPRSSPRKWVELPVCREKGGVLPGIDLNNRAAIQDILDGRR